MRQKTSSNKKKQKNTNNISLRRKLGLMYKKAILGLKIVLMIFVCLFVFTKYFTSIKTYLITNIYQITTKLGFRLENVIIEGQQNVDELTILKVLNANKRSSIFALKLDEISNNLKKSKWIKEVYVSRRLPNTVYIKLFEREPIAIWQINNQLFLVDEEGYKISKDIQPFSHLLHVVGEGANIYASQLVLELKKYPALLNKTLVAIRVGDRRWDLNLKGNISIKLPEKEFEAALKYIDALNKNNRLFNQNYKALDLRDRNKYYIQKY
ncbi:cell division protein FtsQ/DivIB [Rickettsia typhi]|uniref:Cell division protein FtsQ n=2 Tax=Rickettsia typhi TaxID=785 RepID=FTSQ_RICTY|nr:cell division protein FtsQ/DivIB [Rickettsia typhi]Q68XB9.1 RecName: Full=Cell division protein FtsQ [Rickettsia typhi str. Wilmington]AAU03723.1 cell division protein FtsQ [Rickettsia typhi str. Wilmington]AFE54100.1 cell division protein ftsQ [Rickettsia typhi str. TH1527]AFE54939.1 cell division protein ftsQ [Rickettsia typhi str. B9991CWPP]